MNEEPSIAKSDPRGWNDQRVEQIMGQLLRAGVIIAAAIVLVGGVVFLVRHGDEKIDYQHFHGQPAELCSVSGIVDLAKTASGRGLIQLGLLALVGTPIARVVFSIYAFGRERDWLYVAITLVVFAVLLYSLVFDSSA
jgi:uncharacterized membrane protein